MADDITYSGNPAGNQKDAVRFLVGDTDVGNAELLDSEIEYELAQSGNLYDVAANLCIVIALRYARTINRGSRTLTLNRGGGSSSQDVWLRRAEALRRRANNHVGPIFASDAIVNALDSGGYKAIFDIGMHDNPEMDRLRIPPANPELAP